MRWESGHKYMGAKINEIKQHLDPVGQKQTSCSEWNHRTSTAVGGMWKQKCIRRWKGRRVGLVLKIDEGG